MKNKLKKYFPMIRTKGEVLEEVKNNKKLWKTFCSWKEEYTFICLDIFGDIIQNEEREIENRLEEWFVFLSQDDPDMIIKLLNKNPGFQKIYEEVYNLCLNSERMMNMFSKELEILDRNTVKLMIDEMEEELAGAKKRAQEAEEQAQKRVDEAEKRAREAEEKLRELERNLAGTAQGCNS